MKFNPDDYVAIGIHGFNVKDGGESTTDKLAPFYEKSGIQFIEFDIGYFDLLKVRFGSRKKAKKLADLIYKTGKKAIVVCHSHGNVIADIASKEFNANIIYHVAINPALNVSHEFHPSIQLIDTYYNQFDKVVTWGKRLRYVSPFRVLTPLAKLKKWIPSFANFKLHQWGEAGRYGFNTGDTRNDQLDTSEELSMPEVVGHSDIFRNRKLRHWGDFVVKKNIKRLKNIKVPTLLQKQEHFTVMASSLINHSYKNGYRIALKELESGLSLKIDVTKGTKKLSQHEQTDLIEYWEKLGGVYSAGRYYVNDLHEHKEAA